MEKQLIECVPNFSEGNDMEVIKQITDQIETVNGVRLLDVDPGKATNRTVVTFVGPPAAVVEAAFLAIKKASEVIDMRLHHGEHPRFGATDVCPLVPISNISMEETAEWVHRLAERVGNEIKIPVYCYEFAANNETRRNLASVRQGEYEGLPEKLKDSEWKPDYGPATFVPKTGAIAIGARNFLVAYNVNLNTTSTRRANAIAFDVREAGRLIKDDQGNQVRIPGSLKKVKAIGWYIEEYGVAQISINLTDITVTPVHMAFEEVSERARDRGIRVTGSELVGLIPLQAILDAGKYFLVKQQRSLGIPEREIIKIAVKSLGLDELRPFHPEEKIIEYLLASATSHPLIDMDLKAFAEETASESPAPGGGSIAAYMGGLGAALGTMVANLSAHKRGWDDRWLEFSEWAEKGMKIVNELTLLVDEDTKAFNRIMDAFGMAKSTEEEKTIRKRAIQDATRHAIEIPFQVMEKSFAAMEILKAMAETGNPNSVSDAGVGALAVRSAVIGAYLNVLINSKDLEDQNFVNKITSHGQQIVDQAEQLEDEILKIVHSKL